MTHLPFIVASYAVFLAASVFVSVEAGLRLRRSARRLDALDRRKAAP